LPRAFSASSALTGVAAQRPLRPQDRVAGNLQREGTRMHLLDMIDLAAAAVLAAGLLAVLVLSC
jgi:hypothetical protein